MMKTVVLDVDAHPGDWWPRGGSAGGRARRPRGGASPAASRRPPVIPTEETKQAEQLYGRRATPTRSPRPRPR